MNCAWLFFVLVINEVCESERSMFDGPFFVTTECDYH